MMNGRTGTRLSHTLAKNHHQKSSGCMSFPFCLTFVTRAKICFSLGNPLFQFVHPLPCKILSLLFYKYGASHIVRQYADKTPYPSFPASVSSRNMSTYVRVSTNFMTNR